MLEYVSRRDRFLLLVFHHIPDESNRTEEHAAARTSHEDPYQKRTEQHSPVPFPQSCLEARQGDEQCSYAPADQEYGMQSPSFEVRQDRPPDPAPNVRNVEV